MSMRFLILAGASIVAITDSVVQDAEGISTPEGRYPYASGVTSAQGVVAALIPADFDVGRYEWSAGRFVRLPDPPSSSTQPSPLSKLAFRRLFAPMEQLAIDNYDVNPTLSADLKMQMRTWTKNIDAATEICLTDPELVAGVPALEQMGLIGPDRAAQVLAGLPPPQPSL